MERSVTERTLRIDNKLYKKVKKEADSIGSTYNSFLMVLISLGLKVYKSDVVICSELEKEVER